MSGGDWAWTDAPGAPVPALPQADYPEVLAALGGRAPSAALTAAAAAASAIEGRGDPAADMVEQVGS